MCRLGSLIHMKPHFPGFLNSLNPMPLLLTPQLAMSSKWMRQGPAGLSSHPAYPHPSDHLFLLGWIQILRLRGTHQTFSKLYWLKPEHSSTQRLLPFQSSRQPSPETATLMSFALPRTFSPWPIPPHLGLPPKMCQCHSVAGTAQAW